MTVKYVVISGPVRSRFDWDTHDISCSTLMELYGVKRSECICMDESEIGHSYNARILATDLIVLRPLASGKYQDYIKNARGMYEL